MPIHGLRRSASVSYGGYRDDFHHLSSPDPAKLRRVLSLSRIEGSKELPFISYAYRESPYPSTRYNQAWDVYGNQWYDRRYYTSPVYWPYPTWRFRYLDPPESLYWNYPTLSWYPRTSRIAFFDMMNPSYWRRYTDPYFSRPLYYPYRPWAYESMDIARAINMYNKDLIGRNTLEKYWLAPRAWGRWNDYTPPYRHSSWYTSPRRHYYSYPYYY